MKSRKDQISCIVEQTLLEAQGSLGYMSGVRMGAFPRAEDRLPEKLNVMSLSKSQQNLATVISDPASSPFLKAAAVEQMRDVQRDILTAADPKYKAKIEATLKGMRRGRKLRQYVIDPVKGLFAGVGTKAFNLATSADSGTLRGKGFKV